MIDDKQDQIRQRAYELWESEERPQGEDIRHWMQAEDELHAGQLEEVVSEDRERSLKVDQQVDESLNTPEVSITNGEVTNAALNALSKFCLPKNPSSAGYFNQGTKCGTVSGGRIEVGFTLDYAQGAVM